MSDLILICKECDAEYIFTQAEQRDFAERGFVPPQRCPTWRRRRRANAEAAPKPARRRRDLCA
jgi:hypothetical protein